MPKKKTDEDYLKSFVKHFDRVGLTTKFIQNDDGIITHQVLLMHCGEKMVMSEPQELDWPLSPVPLPEEVKAVLN